jgi:hypothetical protein
VDHYLIYFYPVIFRPPAVQFYEIGSAGLRVRFTWLAFHSLSVHIYILFHLFIAFPTCYLMDHQDVQQQQKDFFNPLFISPFGAETVQRGNESHPSSIYGGTLPSPTEATMPSSNPVIPNFPLNFDLITQIISSEGQQSGLIGQGQYSPQLVLEQRLKLNQLHQLQLQNQILQQQVRRFSPTLCCAHLLSTFFPSWSSSMAKAAHPPLMALPTVRNLKTPTPSLAFPHLVSPSFDSSRQKRVPITSQSTPLSYMHNLAPMPTTSPLLPSAMSIPHNLDQTISHNCLPICTSLLTICHHRTTLARRRPTSSSTRPHLFPFPPPEIWTSIFRP